MNLHSHFSTYNEYNLSYNIPVLPPLLVDATSTLLTSLLPHLPLFPKENLVRQLTPLEGGLHMVSQAQD